MRLHSVHNLLRPLFSVSPLIAFCLAISFLLQSVPAFALSKQPLTIKPIKTIVMPRRVGAQASVKFSVNRAPGRGGAMITLSSSNSKLLSLRRRRIRLGANGRSGMLQLKVLSKLAFRKALYVTATCRGHKRRTRVKFSNSISSGNLAPKANAGSDAVLYLPEGQQTLAVTLDASASTDDLGISKYIWDGVPNPDNIARPLVFLGLGTHRFTLRVIDAEGLDDSASVTIVVEPSSSIKSNNKAPHADAGLDQTVNLKTGESTLAVTLDALGSTDDHEIISYVWSGDPDPADVAQPVVELAEGRHTFTLQVIDSEGLSDSAQVTIDVKPLEDNPSNNPALRANAGPDQEVYVLPGKDRAEVTLDGSASKGDTGISSYAWAGNPDPADSVKAVLQLPVGVYYFTLTVNAAGGKTDSDQVKVVVKPSPQLGECSDGLDNDGDGLIDWPYDLGCSGPEDDEAGILARAKGWTVFTPSKDARIYYVSSSDGNDSWSGLAPTFQGGTVGPLKSISKALSLVRHSPYLETDPAKRFSDWVLVKRGDVFYNQSINLSKCGRSASDPMVIATYGNSTKRPLLIDSRIVSSAGGAKWIENIAIMGLELYGESYDPFSTNFNPLTPQGAVGIVHRGQNLTFENNVFRYQTGVVIESIGGNTYNGVEYPGGLRNVYLNRNVYAYSYSDSAHASGTYLSTIDGLRMNGNVFIKNGWTDGYHLRLKPAQSDITAYRTVHDGALALVVDGSSFTLTGLDLGNVNSFDALADQLEAALARARGKSDLHIFFRAGSLFFRWEQLGRYANGFIKVTALPDGSAGTDLSSSSLLGLSQYSAEPTIFNHDMYLAASSKHVHISDNIATEASSHGLQLRPGGIIEDSFFADNGISYFNAGAAGEPNIVRNVVTVDADDITPALPRGWGAEILQDAKDTIFEDNIIASHYGNGAFGLALSSPAAMTVRNNIVYNWRGSALLLKLSSYPAGLVVEGNYFAAASGSWIAQVPSLNLSFPGSFTGNTYAFAGDPASAVRVGSGKTSLSNFINLVGDTQASVIPKHFKDPNRSLSTYSSSLGLPPSKEAFYQKLFDNRRYSWDERYTAKAINAYIRDGFSEQ